MLRLERERLNAGIGDRRCAPEIAASGLPFPALSSMFGPAVSRYLRGRGNASIAVDPCSNGQYTGMVGTAYFEFNAVSHTRINPMLEKPGLPVIQRLSEH
jgi:hypothetical protein